MATELAGMLRHKKFLVDSQKTVQGNDVRLKGGVTTDFPQTGDKVMPAGAVVVKKTADGLYYLANDASNGDRNTAAVVTSTEKPDNDWKDKTLTWALHLPSGAVESGTVVASGGDEADIAAWVTLLNADPAFRARFIASDAGSSDLLVITSLAKGRVGVRITMNLDTAYGTDTGTDSYTEGSGAEADYRVVNDQRSLVSLGGASRDSDATPTLLAGRFKESELTGLTLEAKAVLMGRGSIFE